MSAPLAELADGPLWPAVHAAATLLLTGLIWTVQLVHYPLFAQVAPEQWSRYHRSHSTRIGWLVLPLMAIEALAAALLLARAWRSGAAATLETLGVALVVVHVASTAFLQVPLHARLARGFERAAIERLVATNWVRTIAWSVRAWIALELLRGG